jgi:hypothetical protein
MEIVDTFEVLEGSLYSVLFDSELGVLDENGEEIPIVELHEFSRLFNFWEDIDRLRMFFETNESDLKEEFWDGITIDDAIRKTRNEARRLKSILLNYARIGNTKGEHNLSALFKPLVDGKIEKKLERDKAKVEGHKTWLRIYAIRIDVNFFIICGGAIKLRKTLNDREYLLNELKKIEITRNTILNDESGVFDICELY